MPLVPNQSAIRIGAWMQQIKLDGTLQPLRQPKPVSVPRTRGENTQWHKDTGKRMDAMSWLPQPATKWETSFRHSHWKAKREKVYNALERSGVNVNSLVRYRECGSNAVVEWCEEEKRHRVSCDTCKSRHCEPCQRARAGKMAANLRDRLEQEADGRYRFITLTIKHSDTPLAVQIQKLFKWFRKLRGTRLWKDSQRGGASILEVKWIEKTRRWHPHLHVVAEGGFMDQGDLRAAWLTITGDSTIVDIRKLDSAKDASYYVAKYVTKGTSNEVWNDVDASAEWITAIKGVRICGTFGTWRGYRLMASKPPGGIWIKVELLDALMTRVARGGIQARLLFESLPGAHDDTINSS